MKTRPYNSIGSFLVLFLLLVSSSKLMGFQGNGKLLNFQGSLYENGEAVNGERNFEFTIALDQGTWSETHNNVLVVDGLYAVILGEQSDLPEDLFYTTNERFITIKVGNNVLGTTSIFAPFGLFDQNKYLLKSDTSKFLSLADTILFLRQTDADTFLPKSDSSRFFRADSSSFYLKKTEAQSEYLALVDTTKFMQQKDSIDFIRESEKDQFMSQADSALFIRESEKDQFMSQADSALFIRESEKDQFMSQADSALFLRVEEKFNGGVLSLAGVKNLNLRNDSSGLGAIEVLGTSDQLLGTLKSDTTTDNSVQYGSLSLSSSEGHDLARLDRDDGNYPGAGRLSLFDPQGNLNMEVGSNGTSAGSLELYDSLGSLSTILAGFANGGSAMYFYDSLGGTNMRFNSSRGGGGYYELLGRVNDTLNVVTYQMSGNGQWSNLIGRNTDGSVKGRVMTGFPFDPNNPGIYLTKESAGEHMASLVGDKTNGASLTLNGPQSTNFWLAGNHGGDLPFLEMYGQDSVDAGNGNYYKPSSINLSVNQTGAGKDIGHISLNNTLNNSTVQLGLEEMNNGEVGSRLLMDGPNSSNIAMGGQWNNTNRPYFNMSGIDSIDYGNGNYGIPTSISFEIQESQNGNDYASFGMSNTNNNSGNIFSFSQLGNGSLAPYFIVNGSESINLELNTNWNNSNLPTLSLTGIDSVSAGNGNYYIPSSLEALIAQNGSGHDYARIDLKNTLNDAGTILSFSEGNNGVFAPTLQLLGPNGRLNFGIESNYNTPDLPTMYLMGVDSVDSGGGNYYIPQLMSFSAEQNSNGKDYSYVTLGNSANTSAFNLRFHDKAQNELLPTIYFDGVKSRIDMGFDDSQSGEDRPLVNFMGPNSALFSFWGDWSNPDLPTFQMAGIDSVDSGGGNYFIPSTVNLAIYQDQNGNDYSYLNLSSTDSENFRIQGSGSNANLPVMNMFGENLRSGSLPELVQLGIGQTSGVDHVYFNMGTTTKTNITLTTNYDSNLPGMYWHGNQSSERLIDIGGSQDVGNSIDNIFFRLGATNQDSYSSPLFEAKTESDANGQWSTLLMRGNSSTNIEIGAKPSATNGDDLGRIGVFGTASNNVAGLEVLKSSTNVEWGSLDLSGTTSGVGMTLSGAIDLYDDGSFITSHFYMNDNSGNYVEIMGNGSGTFSGNVTADTLFHNQIFQNSDLRLKENIHTLSGSLAKVNLLRGVSYSWKNDELSSRKIGFIAQEVEEILPEVVATKANGFKAVSYAELTAVLVEALKELSNKVDALEKENQNLKLKAEESNDLKSQVLSLEERLAQIEALINQKSTGNN